MTRQRILFAGPDMGPLADKVAATRPDEIRRGKIRWDRFGDKQWDLEILEDVDDLSRHSVSFLMGFTDPQNQPAQLDILDELVTLGVGRLQLLMPFHPTATNERKFRKGSVPSAVAFARRLTKTVGSERCNLYIYDVHAPAVLGMFDSGIKVKDRTATTLLKDWIEAKGLTNDVVLVFPDRGAKKRFEDMFNGKAKDGRKYVMAACYKIRDGERRIVKLCPEDEDKVVGKFVIVVDDMYRTGGTTLECVNATIEAGAVKVGTYATHPDFEPGAMERFMEAQNVEFVLVTDSSPWANDLDGRGPFKVLSLKDLLAEDVCNDLTITERELL